MRQFLFILFALSFAFNVSAWELPKLWQGSLLSKLGLPESRVQDEASLLPWDHRLKLNQYLSDVNQELNLDWQIILLPSLEGTDIDERANENLSRRSENAAVFILSQSDRTFKLAFSNALKDQLGESKIQEMVSLMIPSLSKADVQSALFLLLETSAYQLKPDYQLTPPRPSVRKHRSLKGFTYFLAAFFFIFLLGHKVFRGPVMKAQYTSAGPIQSQGFLYHNAFFLKLGVSPAKKVFEEYSQRLEALSKQSNISVAFYQTKTSDLYPAAHFRSSLSLTILALTGLYFFPLEWRDPIYILAAFAQALILGYLLAFIPRVKKLFTSKREMKEETFQLLIETLATSSSILNEKAIILGHSKLENKVDFIFSSSLLEALAKSPQKPRTKKEISQFFKDQIRLLKSGDFTSFLDALLSFVELSLSRKDTFERPLSNVSVEHESSDSDNQLQVEEDHIKELSSSSEEVPNEKPKN